MTQIGQTTLPAASAVAASNNFFDQPAVTGQRHPRYRNGAGRRDIRQHSVLVHRRHHCGDLESHGRRRDYRSHRRHGRYYQRLRQWRQPRRRNGGQRRFACRGGDQDKYRVGRRQRCAGQSQQRPDRFDQRQRQPIHHCGRIRQSQRNHRRPRLQQRHVHCVNKIRGNGAHRPGDDDIFGTQANEQGIRSIVQSIATLAATTYSASDPNASASYTALNQRVYSALAVPPGVQGINDIAASLSNAQVVMQATQSQHQQTTNVLTDLLQSIEGVDQNTIGAQILSLQTSLSGHAVGDRKDGAAQSGHLSRAGDRITRAGRHRLRAIKKTAAWPRSFHLLCRWAIRRGRAAPPPLRD